MSSIKAKLKLHSKLQKAPKIIPSRKKDVEEEEEEKEEQISLFSPLNFQDPNPIKDPAPRDNARLLILQVVVFALMVYCVAILVANYNSPTNGVPSISLMLAFQTWLSPFLIVFQCIYMSTILVIALTMTSASHVTNDQEEIEQVERDHKENAPWWVKWLCCCSKNPFNTLSWLILILYLLYFPTFLLIHVVKVTEMWVVHICVAIAGIVFALLCHLCQYLKRCLIYDMFERAHGRGRVAMESVEMSKEFIEDGDLRMVAIFGTRSYKNVLRANLAVILIAIGSGVVFMIMSRTGYEPESTTVAAVFEYALYGLVIFLDSFRMLDVWCSNDVFLITNNDK